MVNLQYMFTACNEEIVNNFFFKLYLIFFKHLLHLLHLNMVEI